MNVNERGFMINENIIQQDTPCLEMNVMLCAVNISRVFYAKGKLRANSS